MATIHCTTSPPVRRIVAYLARIVAMRLLGKLLLAALAAAATPALAQQYPDPPIRLVVPYATGGGTDLMARIIGQELSKSLRQTVFVDNKPGAGAVIRTPRVAKARPDGSTLRP